MSTPPNDPNTPQWGNPGEPPEPHRGEQPPGYQPGQPTPQSGGKFGTAAYNPNAYGGPMEEPEKFKRLKSLLLVIFAVNLIAAVTSSLLVQTAEFEQGLLDMFSGLGLPQDELQMQVEAQQGFGFEMVGQLIGVALFALVYLGLRANKNWARIVGIVFAIIGIIFTLIGYGLTVGLYFVHFWGIISIVLGVVYIGLTIWWLVLAFSTDVVEYLEQFKR